MEKKFITTAFGKERPGFVADIARVIYENGCNLEDSTMTGLSDEFALILLFSGREEEGIEEQGGQRCCRKQRQAPAQPPAHSRTNRFIISTPWSKAASGMCSSGPWIPRRSEPSRMNGEKP